MCMPSEAWRVAGCRGGAAFPRGRARTGPRREIPRGGAARAGVSSEGQAKIGAEQIIAGVRGDEDAARYQGVGACSLEMGQGAVGRVDVNFLGGPSTPAAIQPPSLALRAEKTAFGAT